LTVCRFWLIECAAVGLNEAEERWRNDLKEARGRRHAEVAEPHIVVFEPERPGRSERPLDAGACGPAKSRTIEARHLGRRKRVGGNVDPVVEPGEAALHIEQRASKRSCREADAAGGGTDGVRAHTAIGGDEEAGGGKAGG